MQEIPTSLTQEMVVALRQRYGKHLQSESVEINGIFSPGYVQLYCIITRQEDTLRYDINIWVPTTNNALNSEEALNIAIDFLDYYLKEYFDSDRQLLLPLDYQLYPFGEYSVFARGDITNPHLDRWADSIIESGQVQTKT